VSGDEIGGRLVRDLEDCADPQVSVCIVSYNHVDWIRRCVDSVLSQRVDFSVEILISDDCSLDGTAEIVRDIAHQYPGVVRQVPRETNLGSSKNWWDVHLRARGRFIAHLDGDDFMLPGKLAFQHQLLDSQPAIVMSTHAALTLGADGVLRKRIPPANPPELGSAHDLVLLGNYIPHSSIMYRTENGMSTFAELPIIDYEFHMRQAQKGPIHYHPEALIAYREHPEGLSRSVAAVAAVNAGRLRALDVAREAGVAEPVVTRRLLNVRRGAAHVLLKAGDIDGFRGGVALSAQDRKLATRMHRVENRIAQSDLATRAYRAVLSRRH